MDKTAASMRFAFLFAAFLLCAAATQQDLHPHVTVLAVPAGVAVSPAAAPVAPETFAAALGTLFGAVLDSAARAFLCGQAGMGGCARALQSAVPMYMVLYNVFA